MINKMQLKDKQPKGSVFLQQVFDVKITLKPDMLVADVTFHAHHEGPPGCAHGGSQASVLDELMGTAAYAAGYISLAAHLEIDYRAPVPLETPLRAEVVLHQATERKILTKAKMYLADDNTLVTEGQAVFVRIDQNNPELHAKLANMSAQPEA